MKASLPTEPVIEFRDAGFCTRAGQTILQQLNLSIVHGETVVLLGRSGSGKTTALKLVNRVLEPTEGEVRIAGRASTQWDAIDLRRRIGYVIQEAGLFPHFTVGRNVGLVPRLTGWPPERIQARVSELLSMVGLPADSFTPRYPRELSGGQRQRVGVARALAADPPILLMDEPFGALDPLTRAELQSEFRALQARLCKTVVFVTHDVPEALRLGSRIALLEAGRLVGVYTPEEFLRATEPLAAAYVAAFRTASEPRRSEPAR